MSKVKEKLIKYFQNGCKGIENKKLGVEVEHFIVNAKDLKAISYYGKHGIKEIFLELCKVHKNEQIVENGELLGFITDKFAITLEPGAQLEISIAPFSKIAEIEKVYIDFRKNLDCILAQFGYIALNTGAQVASKVDDIKIIPKKRYELMDKYFTNLSENGRNMMRGTSSLQVSIDYESEEDFRKKFQASFYYSPLFKLLLDNSYCFEGKKIEGHLFRTRVWRGVDNTRCGIIPNVFNENYNFADYADFLCKMPLIFDSNEQEKVDYRSVEEVFEDKEIISDKQIEHILSLAFPDVRAKRYIEIRSADSVDLPYILAYCALIKGLIYSQNGLDRAQEVIRKNKLSDVDIVKAEDNLINFGWEGKIYGQDAKEFARSALKCALCNLENDEKKYLNVFEDVIANNGIRSKNI